MTTPALTQGKFVAQISKKKKHYFLGTFDTPELASKAYITAKRLMHQGCTI